LDARRGACQSARFRIAAAGIIYVVKSELSRPHISGAHHFGFSVRDLDRSIRFYCDVLGAGLVRPALRRRQAVFCWLAIVSLGATGLDLFEHASNGGEGFDPARTGLDHLGFATESVEDLEAWASWLDACNIPHSGVREVAAGDTAAEPLGAMLDFADPDGLEFLFLDSEKIRKAGVYRTS
jgi:glyoxylase I family protein